MTEKEAVKALRLEGGLEITGKTKRVVDFFEGLDMAIKALEEIQQYRAVGSVEECWEAVEMRKEKKPKLNNKRFLGKDTYTCQRCGNVCLTKYANERQNNNFCWDCGQAIDWSEEE